MSLTYPVREDSLLLKQQLSKLDLEGRSFLEVGTGSGEVAVEAARKGADVTAVDSNVEAVRETKRRAKRENLNIEVLVSDLLEGVSGKFDIIVFNPPYLPGERENEKDALIGGEKGIEITEKFLEQAKDQISDAGFILFVASSLADLEDLKKKFDLQKIDEESLWFEKLFVYRLSAC